VETFPETPPLSEASFSGHLWIQELVTGRRLRFQVAQSGLLSFGAPKETFDNNDIPLQYRRATEYVRDELDLTALRNATDDTESVTFFGIATLCEGIDYDWSELPPFVGVDIWSDKTDAYLSPDAGVKAYDAVGLPSLPAVEKEASAKYTDLDGYVAGEMPSSKWNDGTAFGVLVRDKSGGRGIARRADAVETDADTETVDTPEGVAEIYATNERIDLTTDLLAEAQKETTVEAVLNRLLSDVVRENYTKLYSGDELVVSEKEFRSVVAERVRRRLS
jgi:hypothetical protein